MQVMPILWTRWSTPLFHMTQSDQFRWSPGIQCEKGLDQFPDDHPVTRREPANSIRAVIKHIKETRTFGRRVRQRHTKTSRIHAPQRRRRNPALRPRETSICQWRTTPPPPAFFLFPRPRSRPLSALPRPAPSVSTCITPDTSAEASLSRFCFLEILDLTGNIPSDGRNQSISSSSRPNVKNVNLPNSRCQGHCLASSSMAAKPPKFNWSYGPPVYRFGPALATAGKRHPKKCRCSPTRTKSANQRSGSIASSWCRDQSLLACRFDQ